MFLFRAALVALAVASPAPALPETAPMIVAAAPSAGFLRWREEFRSRARAAGISSATFDAAFAGVGVNARVIELDGRQAEFTKTVGEYLASTVPASRIEAGRAKAREWRSTLAEIQRRYGVDAPVVMGIWGIETNFGGFMGGTKVIEGLATLAYDGRRRAWAERELIAALKILQSGDIAPSRMEGSWAGAMGHTQFMPTSYLAYAVDFGGDGRRDVWNRRDPGDALASAANYLRKHGWRYGQPWGVEVVLPDGFDYRLATQKPRRDADFWARAGVRGTDGKAVADYGDAGLWLPMGARGPAFLVYHNFDVIKRYNNADAYALAVGHLGDRIYGKPAIRAAWPTGEKPLSRREIRELQERLTRAGHDTRGADGIVGPNTRAAIRAFQRRAGMVPDGHPGRAVLDRLR